MGKGASAPITRFDHTKLRCGRVSLCDMLSTYCIELAMLIRRMVFWFERFRIQALVALLAVGLVGTAFGHHFAPPEEQAVVSFYNALGAADDLCGEGLLSGKANCSACRLVSAFVLADTSVSSGQVGLNYARQVYYANSDRAAGVGLFTLPQSRAPPLA